MILFNPVRIVPKPLRREFQILRAVLVLAFLGAGVFFGYGVVFPSQDFLLSFENPDTGKSTLEEPSGPNGKAMKKGHIGKEDLLRTYAGTVGSFSSVHVELSLESDSARPTQGMTVSLRKSYRSFFLPEGEAISVAPKDRGFLVGKTPYLFSDGKLSPFLSDRAALSWFPKEKIAQTGDDVLKVFPPEETYVGFRPGTLLSDAEGVYAIDADQKAHPIGSTAIFESLGFDWNAVTPADEEEIRFHKRGRIFLFDAAQPDGTVFYDPMTKRHFIIENGTRRSIESKEYLETLMAVSKPIVASESALTHPVSCELKKVALALRPTYSCDILIGTLQSFPGGSFEVELSVHETIHAATLATTFRTEPDKGNASLFLRQIRERFDAVYGGR